MLMITVAAVKPHTYQTGIIAYIYAWFTIYTWRKRQERKRKTALMIPFFLIRTILSGIAVFAKNTKDQAGAIGSIVKKFII